MMARALRYVGNDLQMAGGGARFQAVEPKSASEVVGEIVRGADDETTVVGGAGALGVDEAARASARGDDDIRIKLDQLMDLVGAVNQRSVDALSQGQEALSRADNVMDVVSSLSSRVGRVETGSVVVSPTRASPEAAVKAPVELELGGDRVMKAREVSETVMGKVRGEAPPDDPSLSPIKRLDAQMAPSASDASVHQSPKQMRTRSATVVEQVARERARAGAYADTHGEALVAKHGVAGAAAFIASRWSLDDAGRLALERSLELEYGTGSGRVSPPNVGDEGDDDDLQSVDKNKKADDTGDGGVSTPEQSDDEGEKFELVEYVHGNRTVSRAELLGEGINDDKPPMRVRLVETGRMIRADVDRVLRGDEMQEHADVTFASRHASGPLRAAASTASAQRPAPSLSGSVASSLAASARDDASSVLRWRRHWCRSKPRAVVLRTILISSLPLRRLGGVMCRGRSPTRLTCSLGALPGGPWLPRSLT
jgi:hypothetical protein